MDLKIINTLVFAIWYAHNYCFQRFNLGEKRTKHAQNFFLLDFLDFWKHFLKLTYGCIIVLTIWERVTRSNSTELKILKYRKIEHFSKLIWYNSIFQKSWLKWPKLNFDIVTFVVTFEVAISNSTVSKPYGSNLTTFYEVEFIVTMCTITWWSPIHQKFFKLLIKLLILWVSIKFNWRSFEHAN